MKYKLNYNNYSLDIELEHTSTYGEYGIKGVDYYIHNDKKINEFHTATSDDIDEVKEIKYRALIALAKNDESLMDQVLFETEGMYLFAAETYNGWMCEEIAEEYNHTLIEVKRQTMILIIASILLVLDPTL